ncbi:MAG: CHAD domain-containing protein [Phycisphaerales bacterium]|nr:CHAD domain-containing protein [Phycisphaerales bacterium]
MKHAATQTRRTTTLVPRDVLAAIHHAQVVVGVVGVVPALTHATPSIPVRPACTGEFDPAKPVRVTARAVVAHEFAAIRLGLAHAADETQPLAARLAGVHRARRGLKRLQALGDLIQSGVPHGRTAARSAIRSAKEGLAESRQRDALAGLLEELCALRGQPLTAIPSDSTTSARWTAAQWAPTSQALDAAHIAVAAAERSMRLTAGAPLDWHELMTRLGRSWGRARSSATAAWLGRTETELHEMRKRFQRLADQLTALAGCLDASAGVSRKQLRRAAEHLGRARDLDLLAGKIKRSTAEGRALSKRALVLRARAVRSARAASRAALAAPTAHIRRSLIRRVGRS